MGRLCHFKKSLGCFDVGRLVQPMSLSQRLASWSAAGEPCAPVSRGPEIGSGTPSFPAEWCFSGVGAESLRALPPGGFVATSRWAPGRGCGYRSRAAHRATLYSRHGGHGPARPRPSRWAGEMGGGSSGSPRCLRIFRIGLVSVMKAINRMSPPHAAHCTGNSSPARAISTGTETARGSPSRAARPVAERPGGTLWAGRRTVSAHRHRHP